MKKILGFLLLAGLFLSVSAKHNKPLTVGIVDQCDSKTANLSNSYVKAIVRGGHIPVVITQALNEQLLSDLISRVDVVFFQGGCDVNPAKYGEQPAPKLGRVSEERDAFEYAVLREVAKQRKPCMGTCRGLQVINVFFGGSLYQDLPTDVPSNVNHRPGGDSHKPMHTINVAKDSRFYKILKKETMGVNSMHHQAVKRLAPGFRIVATAPDGVVEAIECDSLPISAIQFHPENLLDYEGENFKELYLQLKKYVKKRK